MEHLTQQFHLDGDIVLRVAMTLIAGFLLGLERERHGRAAGLRTTLLVALSACMVMLVSEFYYVQTYELVASGGNTWRPDPTRLAAGALSGMGFLGAGVIIHERANVVRGVTTAAGLWLTTALGMCFGSGLHGIGVLCTILAFVILYWLPKVEKLIQDDWFTDFTVTADARSCSMEGLREAITKAGAKIDGLELSLDKESQVRRARFHLKMKKVRQIEMAERMTEQIGQLAGVKSTHWEG